MEAVVGAVSCQLLPIVAKQNLAGPARKHILPIEEKSDFFLSAGPVSICQRYNHFRACLYRVMYSTTIVAVRMHHSQPARYFLYFFEITGNIRKFVLIEETKQDDACTLQFSRTERRTVLSSIFICPSGSLSNGVV